MSLLRMAPLVCLSGISFSTAVAEEVQFRDRLTGSGIDYVNVSGSADKRFIVSSLGSGAALLDYDGDGDLDLYLVNGARLDGVAVRLEEPNRLYRNEGGWRFTDVTGEAGVGDRGWGYGSAVGDYDNDGLPDLYVTNLGKDVLYRNRGDGSFENVTERAGVGGAGFGTSAAFFDADRDGSLDLYVVQYTESDVSALPEPGDRPSCQWFGLPVFCGPSGLAPVGDVYYRNDGSGRFVEQTIEAGFAGVDAYGLGIVTGDYDDDGDPDLYVANDSVPNFLFQNQGDGTFREIALLAGVAYNADGLAQAGMGVDFGDLDGDGRLDLFVSNFSHDTNTAYRNVAEGIFLDTTTDAKLRMPSWFYLGWGTRFVDFDGDGDEDLFVANGHVYPEADRAAFETSYAQENHFFWNDGAGSFRERAPGPGDATRAEHSSRGAAFGDMDNDGDVDVVVVNIDEPPSLLENERFVTRSVVLRLIGRESNRDALGAQVRVSSRSRTQVKEVHLSGSFLSSSDARLYFGFPEGDEPESIRIRWPSGREQQVAPRLSRGVMTVIEKR